MTATSELSEVQALLMIAAGLVALQATVAVQVLFLVVFAGLHVFNRLATAELTRQRERLS